MKRICLLLVIAASAAGFCFAQEKEAKPAQEKHWSPAEVPQKKAETFETFYHSRKPAEINHSRSYGNASISKVTGIDANFFFRCNIKQWPAVIGENIPVRIAGVSARVTAAENATSKELEQQTREFIQAILAKAEKEDALILKNIRRGSGFYLIADVIASEDDLARLLIEKGFARKAGPGDIAAPIRTIYSELRNETPAALNANTKYMASKSSKVFHASDCRFAKTITSKNGAEYSTRQQAINSGRRPCKQCKP